MKHIQKFAVTLLLCMGASTPAQNPLPPQDLDWVESYRKVLGKEQKAYNANKRKQGAEVLEAKSARERLNAILAENPGDQIPPEKVDAILDQVKEIVAHLGEAEKQGPGIARNLDRILQSVRQARSRLQRSKRSGKEEKGEREQLETNLKVAARFALLEQIPEKSRRQFRVIFRTLRQDHATLLGHRSPLALMEGRAGHKLAQLEQAIEDERIRHWSRCKRIARRARVYRSIELSFKLGAELGKARFEPVAGFEDLMEEDSATDDLMDRTLRGLDASFISNEELGGDADEDEALKHWSSLAVDPGSMKQQ